MEQAHCRSYASNGSLQSIVISVPEQAVHSRLCAVAAAERHDGRSFAVIEANDESILLADVAVPRPGIYL
jgi:hypothetical protein